MMTAENFTLPEAGVVLNWKPTAINKIIDSGVIPKKDLAKRSGSPARLLRYPQLRFIALAQELEKDLNPSGRKRFYQAIVELGDGAHVVKVGGLSVDISRIDLRIHEGVKRLSDIKEQFEARDGDAYFKGRDISVYMVAALYPNETIDEIIEEYPSLSRDQIEAAIAYAKAYPKLGRPYPNRSFKRAFAELAEMGVFEDGEPD